MSPRALVVGGTAGIGHALAHRIASSPSATVTILGRTAPPTLPPNISFQPLEATSMRAIKHFTETFKTTRPHKLDLLIMTQGILSAAGRTETPEGIDRKMALHYYGRHLLVRELMPLLADDAKVLVVLDGKYGNPAKINWDDLDLKRNYGMGQAAQHCMVLNDAMVQYWARQQKHEGNARRHFVHAWPGFVSTRIMRDVPWLLRPLAELLAKPITVSPETCAEYLMGGVDEQARLGEEQGRYWSNIERRGRVVEDRRVWSDEQLDIIAEHTWKIVDAALHTPESKDGTA